MSQDSKNNGPKAARRLQLLEEDLVRVSEIKDHLPHMKINDNPHRLFARGLLSTTGERIYLEWVKSGTTYTSVQAIKRFLLRLNGASEAEAAKIVKDGGAA